HRVVSPQHMLLPLEREPGYCGPWLSEQSIDFLWIDGLACFHLLGQVAQAAPLHLQQRSGGAFRCLSFLFEPLGPLVKFRDNLSLVPTGGRRGGQRASSQRGTEGASSKESKELLFHDFCLSCFLSRPLTHDGQALRGAVVETKEENPGSVAVTCSFLL